MTTFILILLLGALVSVFVFAPLWRGSDEGQADPAPPSADVTALEAEKSRFIEELRGLDIALAEGKLDPHDHAGERARVSAAAERTLGRLRRARAAAAPRHGSVHRARPVIGALAGAGVTVATLALAIHLNGFDLLRNASPHADGSIPLPADATMADVGPVDSAPAAPGGMILDENGQPDPAAMVARLEARIAEGTPSMDELAMLARSYEVLDRRDDAIATYRRALTLEPDNADVMMALGIALFDSGESDKRAEADQVFDRILDLRPGKPEALWFKSLILVDQHEIGQAREMLVRLAAMVTDNPPAREAVASLLAALDADRAPAQEGTRTR